MKIGLAEIKESIKDNWKSGVSVALVSVPLSFSLAIAAGASPMTGIITAVWAGLVAGIIGGSQFNIIGPAGALTGILIGYSLLYSPAILPFLAIISGIIILFAWFFRLDRYLVFVPSSVIHGFTLGVALSIAFGQLNSALGISGLQVHETLIANVFESIKNFSLANPSAFFPFVIGLAIIFGIYKYNSRLPNTIIVALLGILFGYLSIEGIIPITFETIGSKFPELSGSLFIFPKISELFSNTQFSGLTHLGKITVLVKASLVIAFVAILETLISAKTADGMTKTKFNQRREVLGVGFANVVSGIFGGLPASGVFARTALNVKSGARSSFSQIINALTVAVISLVFISGFSYLPLSITAVILVYASIRMVEAEHFRKIYYLDRGAFIIAIGVATLTFVYDATAGIIVGAIVSLLVFANKYSKAELDSSIDPENYSPEDENDKAIIYRLAGALTYFNSKSHVERISRINSSKPFILNFRYLHHLDVDGHEALDEIFKIFDLKNTAIYLSGIKPEREKELSVHSWFNKLKSEGKIFITNDEVLRFLSKDA